MTYNQQANIIRRKAGARIVEPQPIIQLMSLPLQLYMRKKSEGGLRASFLESDHSEQSLHSEDRFEGDLDGSEKLFSFGQNYNSIEQNQKIIQEKANFLSRIRALEEELKSCKSKASLWEKCKTEIANLNKYLQLSAVSLGCSDAGVMKEFFEAIRDLLLSKEVKSKDEKVKAVEIKKKEAELFEKLVDSNKKRYEVQQKMVQLQHENAKLLGLNESLRERSRFHSSERSFKMRQFQEETLMSMQEKDHEMSMLLERNNDLKLELIQYEQTIEALRSELQHKEKDLVETKDGNEELYLECEAHKRQYNRLLEEQKYIQSLLAHTQTEMEKILTENLALREDIRKKRDEIANLRSIIAEAKVANAAIMNKLQNQNQAEQARRKVNLALFLQRQDGLKKSLTSNSRFAINRNSKKKGNRLLMHSKSQLFLTRLETEL